jgi:hypothetical protein
MDQRQMAVSNSDILNQKKTQFQMVKKRVKKIIDGLKRDGILKWKDPDFGPTEEVRAFYVLLYIFVLVQDDADHAQIMSMITFSFLTLVSSSFSLLVFPFVFPFVFFSFKYVPP